MNNDTKNSGYVLRWAKTTAIAVGLMFGSVLASEDLAKTATNPIGDMIQVQLQNQYSPSVWEMDGHLNTAIVQPVVPFDLPFESMPKMITRTTIPYVRTPDRPGVGSKSGLGDTVVLAFGLPKLEAKGQMLGIGPALLLPTATKDETGSEKWAVGPAVVYVNLQHKGTMWGGLLYGLWDFAGDDDREHVSQINVQPIFNKFFADGWYLGLQDIPWVYNDNTNEWNLPIGPRFGKVTKMGKQPLNIFGGAYYNPESTAGTGKWAFKLSVSLLFPK